MSDIELKPCPFCGGEAVVHVNDGVRVICRECGASSKGLVDGYSQGRPNGSAIKGVVKAWNTRKPMERIVEFPTEPIKVADLLIHDTCVYENKLFKGYLGDTSVVNRYSKSDLRQIAEHLLAYCNNAEEE